MGKKSKKIRPVALTVSEFKEVVKESRRKSLQAKLLDELESWSESYEMSFQFWGPGKNNVYIMRGNTVLAEFGGRETVVEVIVEALRWIYRVNRVPKDKRVV